MYTIFFTINCVEQLIFSCQKCRANDCWAIEFFFLKVKLLESSSPQRLTGFEQMTRKNIIARMVSSNNKIVSSRFFKQSQFEQMIMSHKAESLFYPVISPGRSFSLIYFQTLLCVTYILCISFSRQNVLHAVMYDLYSCWSKWTYFFNRQKIFYMCIIFKLTIQINLVRIFLTPDKTSYMYYLVLTVNDLHSYWTN
jgi:hypothetical protein